MAATTPVALDRERIRELTEREEARLNASHRGVAGACTSAPRRVLSAGVASSYQLREPWPIYLEHGEGPEGVGRRRQRDVRLPQRLRLDGPGPRAPGDRPRGRPSATAAGTHFAAPTEDAVVVAEELARRWGLQRWRYTNSGSESTMDAIRIARAYTGRDTVMKIFGSYHGHHDTVMVSIGVEYDKIGPHERPALAALRRRHPAGDRRPGLRGALQRRRVDGAPHRRARTRGPQAGLRDHGAGDDEPRGRAPRARLPRGRARDHRAATASC